MVASFPFKNTSTVLTVATAVHIFVFSDVKWHLKSKACDASVNQLYINNISNNNDTISHRYYPVIKKGNNRIWEGV